MEFNFHAIFGRILSRDIHFKSTNFSRKLKCFFSFLLDDNKDGSDVPGDGPCQRPKAPSKDSSLLGGKPSQGKVL